MKYSVRYKVARLLKKAGIAFDPSSNDAVRNMRDVINGLSGESVQFTVSREPNGEWVAESVNIDGILTGGTAEDDVKEMIRDAIFTYFDIPPEYCDDTLIREAGEPVVIKQEIYATA